MQIFTGKNENFKVIFNPNTQYYTVYYKNKFLIGEKTKFSQIQSYLN